MIYNIYHIICMYVCTNPFSSFLLLNTVYLCWVLAWLSIRRWQSNAEISNFYCVLFKPINICFKYFFGMLLGVYMLRSLISSWLAYSLIFKKLLPSVSCRHKNVHSIFILPLYVLIDAFRLLILRDIIAIKFCAFLL